MGKPKKRKHDADSDWGKTSNKKAQLSQHYILHSCQVSKFGNFTKLKLSKPSPAEKLRALRNIRDRRLKENVDSPLRMQNVCDLIPETLSGLDLDNSGWHRGCYQRFTMNQDRLHTPPNDENARPQPAIHRSPRKKGMEGIKFPPDKCLFCNNRTWSNGIEKLTDPKETFVAWEHKESGWKQIERMAKDLQNAGCGELYRQVSGKDLFSSEAHFHRPCLKAFYKKHHAWSTSSDKDGNVGCEISTAHSRAYEAVKIFIQKEIILNKKVKSLTVLRDQYIKELERQNNPNPNFRSEKLKTKIERDEEISKSLSFSKVEWKGCCSFWLVFSSEITAAQAATASYKAASEDKLKDTATFLRESILKAFRETKELEWPPTVESIAKLDKESIPEELERFLALVFSGKEPNLDNQEERTKRFIYSIGQDICRAASQGRWKLSKHVLICVTLRHLYRSKQLTTILNRLGHCESYSFGLELETAMAKAIDEADSYLTPQIVTGENNIVFHSEWDNLNKILTNVSGSNVVNSAAGIMLQEQKKDSTTSSVMTPPTNSKKSKRTKKRSLDVDRPETLPAKVIYSRKGPVFPQSAALSPPSNNNTVFQLHVHKHLIWFFCR